MRKLFLSTTVLLLGLSVLFLSSCSDHDYNEETVFNNLTVQMKLGDAQAKALKPIFLEQVAEAKIILASIKKEQSGSSSNFSGARPDLNEGPLDQTRLENSTIERLQEVTREVNAKLSQILSAEQFTAYNAFLNDELKKLIDK
ncbi:MAG: hypothetical protein WCT39_07145 [Candidatus Margulisiibacteriota bacterium]